MVPETGTECREPDRGFPCRNGNGAGNSAGAPSGLALRDQIPATSRPEADMFGFKPAVDSKEGGPKSPEVVPDLADIATGAEHDQDRTPDASTRRVHSCKMCIEGSGRCDDASRCETSSG